MSQAHKLLINGELVEGDASLDVINPATGKTHITVARASEAQADAAVKAAKAAYTTWSKMSWADRAALINKLADAMEAKTEELARALTQEQGKPIAEAMGEVMGAVGFMRYFCMLEIKPKVLEDSDAKLVEEHRRPLGVVAGITPWNFPLLLGVAKIAPALVAGNTFVLKPAPTTPVTSLMVGEMAADILPAGVFNIVTDQNDLGAFLTHHDDVAKVSFTGSTATGKKVMESAASTLKRITLELGGNDAAIVLPDVDVAETAPKIFGTGFMNAGQICVAVKRVYVHESQYDEMCDAIAGMAAQHPVGDGLEQGVAMGPLQNKQQFDKAKGYLDIAKRDGKVIAGGEATEDGGYFIQPTVVRDIDGDSPLVKEEQFAPIMPIVKYDDVDDVIASANATEYGLGGSVWGKDVEKAKEVALKVDSGTVWVNHHLDLAPNLPFSGAKNSGIGVEWSEEGLMEYTQRHVVNIAKA